MKIFLKKEIVFLLFFVLLAVTLSACSDTYDSVADTESESEVPTGENSIEVYSEECLDLSFYATDDEEMSEFIWNHCAASDDGYYYFSDGFLYFYDLNAKFSVPVCNRADCTHSGDDCNASFEERYEYGYDYNTLIYADGYLYTTVAFESDGNINLCRIAIDGSARDDNYMTLYKVAAAGDDGSFSITYPKICIHRGYIYFSDMEESVPKIRRMKLGGDESEIIYETSGLRPSLYRIKYSGDYLFFQSGNFIDDDYLKINAGIFSYNTVSGEIVLIKSGAISTYAVSDDYIYYYDDSAIYKKSLSDGTETKIVSGADNTPIHVVDDTLYIWDEESTLTAYDLNGNELASISDDELSDCYFGDDKNFLAGIFDADVDTIYLILNLDDFLQGKGEWLRIS